MLDELDVFSDHSLFSLILLRDQPEFYSDRLRKLQNNGVQIVYLNKRYTYNFRKLFFLFRFFIKNFFCFLEKNSAVYGIKGCIYFLKIPDKIVTKETLSIHSQFATQASILGLLIKEYYKENNIELNFTFHAYDIYAKNRWFKTLVDSSNKSFSISNYNIRYVVNKYNVSINKINFVPLGVFIPERVSKKEFTETLHIGFMSFWVEMKGLLYLLEAINKLNEEKIPIMLHLAGDGPLKNKAFDYITKNNLSNVITYYGLVKDEKKKQFFDAIDIFVLPSVALGIETDGLPVVLMEAVSYGIPIISTKVTGIPEICIDSYNGFLINQKNSDEIIYSLKEFRKNYETRKKFQTNSLNISKDYDIVRNSLKKLELLNWSKQ